MARDALEPPGTFARICLVNSAGLRNPGHRAVSFAMDRFYWTAGTVGRFEAKLDAMIATRGCDGVRPYGADVSHSEHGPRAGDPEMSRSAS